MSLATVRLHQRADKHISLGSLDDAEKLLRTSGHVGCLVCQARLGTIARKRQG